MEIHRTKILKEIILQTCWQCSLLLPVRFTNVFPFLFLKKISLDRHVLGLKMNFCIQCTDTIFGHAVFVKQKFYLIFASIFLFLNLKIRTLGLWKICHGFTRSPPWFCKESIRVGGSVSNPAWLWEESVNCGDRLNLLLAIFHPEGHLSERWRTPVKAISITISLYEKGNIGLSQLPQCIATDKDKFEGTAKTNSKNKGWLQCFSWIYKLLFTFCVVKTDMY